MCLVVCCLFARKVTRCLAFGLLIFAVVYLSTVYSPVGRTYTVSNDREQSSTINTMILLHSYGLLLVSHSSSPTMESVPVEYLWAELLGLGESWQDKTVKGFKI